MSEPFIAEIRMFAGNFAPRGWAFCNGQIMSIAQNTALFSLLGTTYGGNGQTTFGLPDLRGRVPVGMGQGPGLPNITEGEMAGEPNHTLNSNEMPAHTHTAQVTVKASSAEADSTSPNGKVLASPEQAAIYGNGPGDVTMSSPNVNTSVAGGNQPHNNMQPYLGMNYIIALEGIYPSRN